MIPIVEIPAGAMLDALVAKLMGESIRQPPYSTDIAAAWEVVDKLKDMNQDDASYDFDLIFEADKRSGLWFAQFGDVEEWVENKCWGGCGRGETAPLAICRAALKAVEHGKKA